MNVQVNFWGILAAVASSLVVGSIWYAPPVFGKSWMKLAKIDMSGNRSDIWKPMSITIVVSFVTAYILAHVAYLSNQFFHHSFLQDSLMTALWIWLGFIAARFLTHDAFEGRPLKLTLLNIGNEFVTLMLMGLLIGLIGV